MESSPKISANLIIFDRAIKAQPRSSSSHAIPRYAGLS